MIVSCDSCNASFKVDDSRIPADGVKVRCSKCKNVFVVKPDVGDDFLAEFEEFETFHREHMEDEGPVGEKPPDAAPEQFARIPEEPEEPAGGISFEEFMAKEEPAFETSEPESSFEEPIARESELPEEPLQEESGPEETVFDPSLALELPEMERPPAEEALPEMQTEEASPEMDEAELSVESFFKEQMERGSEAQAEVPPEMAFEEESPEMEETQLSVEAFFKEEMERESKDQARGASLTSLKDRKLEDLVREKGMEKRSVRRRSSFKVILLLILILTLGAAGYLWWQNQGTTVSLPIDMGPSFKAVVERISGLWDDVLGSRKGSVELSGLRGYEEEIGQHRVYIIEGKATNISRRTKKYVKLKVIILDQADNRIKEKEIFCGNVFTREELEKLSPRFFTGEETLQPKRPKDMVVEAQQTISFMALFSGLPREGKSFKIEILEAPGV
jgi:predicted Zn finger-like uncharacterized protein